MKRFVDNVARQRGLQLPHGYAASSAACRVFLDQHARNRNSVQAGTTANQAPAEVGDKQQTRPRKPFAKRRAPERIDRNIPPASGDVHPSDRPSKTNRKATGRKQPPGSAKLAARNLSEANEGTLGAGAPGRDTPLRIPFGNKEVALQLGARYRAGGWYAPPDIDLDGFRQRGWL